LQTTPNIPENNTMKEPYLRSIRLLAECYHQFEKMSSMQIRICGLTPSQFDIIATLGNTTGMTVGELGEKTLITKGTLTGIINRLETKGLVQRITRQEDRRSTHVQLTKAGEQEFERVFLPHIRFCQKAFREYSGEEFASLEKELTKLQSRLPTCPTEIKF
jgi:MarR family transcriptional regulator, 2-MHQ and catechol-resistance regulon repressor